MNRRDGDPRAGRGARGPAGRRVDPRRDEREGVPVAPRRGSVRRAHAGSGSSRTGGSGGWGAVGGAGARRDTLVSGCGVRVGFGLLAWLRVRVNLRFEVWGLGFRVWGLGLRNRV